jgi:hypothetical protein
MATDIFASFSARPKTQSAQERASELAWGADPECNLDYLSNRIRSRGSRGPPCAPEGRKWTENSEAAGAPVVPSAMPSSRRQAPLARPQKNEAGAVSLGDLREVSGVREVPDGSVFDRFSAKLGPGTSLD